MSVEDMMAKSSEDTHQADPDDGPVPGVVDAASKRGPGRPPKAPTKAQAAATGAQDAPAAAPASDDVAELKKMIATQAKAIEKLQNKVDPVAPSAAPQPLHMRASVLPIDVEATGKMTGARAAALTGVAYEELISYTVRAPLNVDGKPISNRRVLIVARTDSSKTAVELGEDD